MFSCYVGDEVTFDNGAGSVCSLLLSVELITSGCRSLSGGCSPQAPRGKLH